MLLAVDLPYELWQALSRSPGADSGSPALARRDIQALRTKRWQPDGTFWAS